jgi:hypothetical protein
VRHEEDRLAPALPDLGELHVDLIPGERVEGSERLVHQQDGRVVDQRPAEGHPVLHPARELVGIPILEALEPHQRHQRPRPVDVVRAPEPAHLDLEEDVVERLLPREQHRVLEDHADRRLGGLDHASPCPTWA